MMERMERDWVEDENLSAEETLRRFESLDPDLTRGPRKGEHLFVEVTSDVGTAPDPSEPSHR